MNSNTEAAADQALRHVNSARLMASIEALARFGGRSDGGVSRQTLSGEDLKARRHLVDEALASGWGVEIDDCANLFIHRPGLEKLPAVLTGSHVDTQPVGGKLDGAYGVLAGLELLRALDESAVRTRRPVEVVIWTNEEGSRFGPGCMGSSAYADPSRLETFLQSRDGDGVVFAEALKTTLEAFSDLPRRRLAHPQHSYVELHIEQGPVLEAAGSPLGVVSGIQSVRWRRVHCSGVAAHAGTTPMERRADAMHTAITLAQRLFAEAALHQQAGLRLTLGRWLVSPNSINTIPESVEFSVDMRCVDSQLLSRFDELLHQLVAEHKASTVLRVEKLFERAPTLFPESMIEQMGQSCKRVCDLQNAAPPLTLTSGAFHDAMYLADHCPSAMIFVPSKNGISHNATEETDPKDLWLGACALTHAVTGLAQA